MGRWEEGRKGGPPRQLSRALPTLGTANAKALPRLYVSESHARLLFRTIS